tara:strand:- start:316 stop:1983 length:1668 start_codon:yes stop_codon:yes gene_type:complete
MALPILPALFRGLAGLKIADKLIPKNAEQLETTANVVSAIKPKAQENRSLVPAEGISDDKMTILPPEDTKEKSIQQSMDIFKQILENLIIIKENVLGISNNIIEGRERDLEQQKQISADQLESRIESDRTSGIEEEAEGQKIEVVTAAKKGLGLLGKLIVGAFAFDVLRKLFEEFAPELYGKIEKGLKDLAKDFEESLIGGLALDTIKNTAMAAYNTIAGSFNLVVGLLSGDMEQAAQGSRQVTEATTQILDTILNPILALLEVGMRDDPNYERTKNVFQDGLKKYYGFMADVEQSFKDFEVDPRVMEQLSFENVSKEITELGNELVNSFKQLFVDLKNFFSFDNLKRIITGEEKPIEQQIQEVQSSDGKFVKEAQQEVIDQMTDQGKLVKESKKGGLFAFGNQQYKDLDEEERKMVDEEVKRKQNLKLYRLDPEGFQERKLNQETMDTLSQNMDNIIDEPRPETVPEVVPEKDQEKLQIGANMRNNGQDPKSIAIVTQNKGGDVINNNDNRTTNTSMASSVVAGGSGGNHIGVGSPDGSIYPQLAGAMSVGARG